MRVQDGDPLRRAQKDEFQVSFSSHRVPQTALNSSQCRDRVTAREPMALRAGAAETKIAVWTGLLVQAEPLGHGAVQ